jgi:hypothetical protein
MLALDFQPTYNLDDDANLRVARRFQAFSSIYRRMQWIKSAG